MPKALTTNSKCEAIFLSFSATYCVEEEDSRLTPMCNHPLNKEESGGTDTLLAMEECRSLFGSYELEIPVDEDLECDDTGVTNSNGKDLDVSKLESNMP